MLIFLKLVWDNRGLVAAGLVAIAFGVLWMRNDYLAAQLETSRKANAIYAKNLPVLRADYQRAVWRATNAEKIKGSISNAKDGPIADSLRVALDGLRGVNASDRTK